MVADAHGTRGCELRVRQKVAACIVYCLAGSFCTEMCHRSSSLLSGAAFPCKTHAHPAWPVGTIDNRLYLGALSIGVS